MRLQTMSRWSPNLLTDEIPRVQITGLYEDFEAGVRAKVLIECVHAGMNLPVKFKLDFWRFDWLRERSLREIALNTARSSALVVVSATRAKSLPHQMERWISAWAQEKNGHPSAMIVLLPKGRDGQARCQLLHERLRRAAQLKHADFFSECFEPQTKHRPDIRKNHRPVPGEDVRFRDNRIASEFIAGFGHGSGQTELPLATGRGGLNKDPARSVNRVEPST